MHDTSLALIDLGRALAELRYHFVTPTPETHRRVIARRAGARDLRDVFGWSLRFERTLVPRGLFDLLEAANAVEESDGGYRATVRFSSLGGALYVHSAYPTDAADSVFFGPDTYRFCRFIEQRVQGARSIVDIGCGSGAGGLVAARCARAERVVLADVSERALSYAEVNAALQGRTVELAHSDVLTNVSGEFDLVVANPPYMRDAGARVYRDGGGQFGEALALRIAREAVGRLAPGGTLLLYTGAPIIGGDDIVERSLAPIVAGCEHSYEELDPDVFGEELDRPEYERVERIAAVALTVRRTSA